MFRNISDTSDNLPDACAEVRVSYEAVLAVRYYMRGVRAGDNNNNRFKDTQCRNERQR